jgi:hypothetical protein
MVKVNDRLGEHSLALQVRSEKPGRKSRNEASYGTSGSFRGLLLQSNLYFHSYGIHLKLERERKRVVKRRREKEREGNRERARRKTD